MHCRTQEEAEDFCKFLDSVGRCWMSGASYAKMTRYNGYKENTCYDFNAGKYNRFSWFVENNYTILEWSDFMNKEFTKADLKNGDVVLRRDGSVDIVCVETNTLISSYGFDYLKDVGEDLTDIKFHDSDFDIIAVRRPTEPHHCQFCAFDFEYGELVYEREKVEEMALEEACKALGKEIKIVKSKG